MRSTVVIDPETMEWASGPEDLPPGAMLKVLSADEKTGAVAAIVKFPAGYLEPKHGHLAVTTYSSSRVNWLTPKLDKSSPRGCTFTPQRKTYMVHSRFRKKKIVSSSL